MIDEEQRDLIELEVRRVLAAEELEVRKHLTSELGGYRSYLQAQFHTLTWGIGLVLIAAALLLTFFLGRSFTTAKENLVAQVDQMVIEYRIVDAYKRRLEEQFFVIASGEAITSRVEASVDTIAGEHLASRVDDLVSRAITAELADVTGEDVTQLLARTVNSELRTLRCALFQASVDAFFSQCQQQGGELTADLTCVGANKQPVRFTSYLPIEPGECPRIIR